MKAPDYTEIICRRFCRFYKGGKEALTCGAYDFIVRNLTIPELASSLSDRPSSSSLPVFSPDDEITTLSCGGCDFLVDGCDYRAGLDSPPCGAFILIGLLMNRAR